METQIISDELKKVLDELKKETIQKMDKIKESFGLESLEMAHGYPNRIMFFVNDNRFVYNQFK